MKKFVLILSVFGVLVVYSIGIRHEAPVIVKPSSLVNKQSSNNSVASASASGSSGGSSNTSSNSTSSSSPNAASTGSQYKDGTYTGSAVNAYWGNVQVSAIISGGKITDVKFLQYPNSHSTSVYINQQVMPYLKQEAIQSQSSKVQLISGATFTSEAFIQSLAAALSQA